MRTFYITSGLVFISIVGAQAQVSSNTTFYVSEGATVSIHADFTNKGKLKNEGILHLAGHVVNEGGFQSEGQIRLNGTDEQKISSKKTLEISELYLDNHVKLQTPVSIRRKLTFEKGILRTNEQNPLIFSTEAIHEGLSDQSHVVGVVEKQAATSFEFPVGNGESQHSFKVDDAGNKTVWATYIPQNPSSISGEVTSNVTSLNEYEYWVIRSKDTQTSVKVSIADDAQVAVLQKGIWDIQPTGVLTAQLGLAEGLLVTTGSGNTNSKEIGIWPNPTSGEFNLRLTHFDENTPAKVEVSTIEGRKLMQMEGSIQELRGIYQLPSQLVTSQLTVRVIQNEHVFTEKLIINK